MLHLLISILGILFTILFVIGTHESAHFLTARLLGIKVLRFSIGFGKTLCKWQDKGGTEYVLALIPLGGYVKMLDENEEPVPEDELPRAFNRQPFYKKFLVVIAGPLTNILCAWVLYSLVFIVGFPTIKPIIGNVLPRSIAQEAGLKPHQEIIKVDNKSITGWPNVMFRLLVHIGDKDDIVILAKNPDKTTTSYRLDLLNWRINDLNPDPLKSLGIVPYEPEIPLVIGKIAADSPAALSSLQIGDKILSLNQKPIYHWLELITEISKNPDKTLSLTIERGREVFSFPIKTGYHRSLLGQKSGFLGISPAFTMPLGLIQKIQYSPLEAFKRGFQEVLDLTYFNLLLFEKMITGKLSLQSLGGPITIFESAGDALNYGFVAFISFLAFLSISIGIINLLPIPGLDGGHLLIYLIEFMIGRPVPINILALLFRLGFIFVFAILIQAIVNDLLRLY